MTTSGRQQAVIPHPDNDGRVLVIDGRLPAVTTDRRRPSEIAEAVVADHGLAVRPVRSLVESLDPGRTTVAGGSAAVLLEWAGDPPAGAQWSTSPADGEEALAAWEASRSLLQRSAWSEPGWFDGAVAWIDEELDALGEERTGPVRTVRHWSISAILSAPTTGGGVVLKEVLGAWEREGPLVRLLGQLAGGVPEVVAVKGRRWLARPFAGPVYEAPYDALRLDVIRHLGRLQRATVGRGDEVLATGALNQGLHELSNHVMLLTLDVPELERWFTPVGDRIEALADLDLPSGVVHGDFHPWNTLVDEAGPFIFDWTDASWSVPILDLSVWLERADRADHAPVLTAWAEGFEIDPDLAIKAWGVAEPLGNLHYAWDYKLLLDELDDTDRASWAHMVEHWVRRAIQAMTSDT